MMKTPANANDPLGVNPAATAAEVRSTPVPVSDDDLRDDKGKRVVPKDTREETRANRLGDAARSATIAEAVDGQIAPIRARAAGLREQREGANPRRAIAKQTFDLLSKACLAMAAVPNSTLDPRRKFLATAPKPGFVIGDTAVMAVVLTRSGAATWLAILLGCSMALSIVMVGSQLGHVLAVSYQRRERGPAPDDCPTGHRDLYDDGRAGADLDRWIIVGASTTGALLMGVTLIGAGQGDPVSLAFGFGLLSALTFGGATAAEAFGTNAAAERLQGLQTQCDSARDELCSLEGLDYDVAHQSELADALLFGAQHRGIAAALTVEADADRSPDSPHVFGYSHTESVARVVPTMPADLAPMSQASSTRSRPALSNYAAFDPFVDRAVGTNGKASKKVTP